tara:strand:- start:3446 stop:5062 length:1617 start_codon:yes stop_codon:yes gene_type:complete
VNEERLIDYLHKDLQTLKGDRGLWNQDLQDVVRYIRPGTSDFLRNLTRGESRHYEIYDGTALWALEQFASGLHTYNTSPTDRWFSLSTSDTNLMEDESVREWLESVSDTIFRELSKPNVGFNQSMHECYLDLGALGTSIIYEEFDIKRDQLVFRTIPLAHCYIRENHLGMVDTLYREMEMTVRQILQKFPKIRNNEKLKTMRQHDKLTISHSVFPSQDETGQKLSESKEFVSFWFCKKLDDGITKDGGILSKGGFDEFPYHVPRWTKLAGEVYGRSPGRTALHDIRVINAVQRQVLMKGDQQINPSLEIEDDSIIGDVATGSGSIIWKEPGSAQIRPVETGGRLDWVDYTMSRLEKKINEAFHVDWLLRQRKNERQTAFEVADERDEKLRMMSPMLGRLQVELFGPLIQRSYNLMAEQGKFAEPDVELGTLEIKYTSPAAKAQFSVKSQNSRRYIEELSLLAQLDPNVIDVIDTDALSLAMAQWSDISTKTTRTPEEIQELRQAKAENEARQMAVNNAPLEASAVKDLAQARSMEQNI